MQSTLRLVQLLDSVLRGLGVLLLRRQNAAADHGQGKGDDRALGPGEAHGFSLSKRVLWLQPVGCAFVAEMLQERQQVASGKLQAGQSVSVVTAQQAVPRCKTGSALKQEPKSAFIRVHPRLTNILCRSGKRSTTSSCCA